jgi:flavoprotein hydroxylase
VLACADDPSAALDDEQRALLNAIGARVLHVLPALAATETPAADTETSPVDRVVDVDGSLLAQLAAAGHAAALVRPDHYLFGGVSSLSGLPRLVDDLRRQLTGGTPA